MSVTPKVAWRSGSALPSWSAGLGSIPSDLANVGIPTDVQPEIKLPWPGPLDRCVLDACKRGYLGSMHQIWATFPQHITKGEKGAGEESPQLTACKSVLIKIIARAC